MVKAVTKEFEDKIEKLTSVEEVRDWITEIAKEYNTINCGGDSAFAEMGIKVYWSKTLHRWLYWGSVKELLSVIIENDEIYIKNSKETVKVVPSDFGYYHKCVAL